VSPGAGALPLFSRALGHTTDLPLSWHLGVLPLCSDFVPQDKIGNEAQGDEEDPKHDEIQVELGVLHVQLSQNGLRLLKVARLVNVAVQVFSVQAIDGEDDTLKAVPRQESSVIK
jgi:hypothetical protein